MGITVHGNMGILKMIWSKKYGITVEKDSNQSINHSDLLIIVYAST
jgi:hypothetical protein